MNRTAHRLHDLAEEYRPGLLLIGTILALGWLMGGSPMGGWLIGPPPASQSQVGEMINRVYRLDGQPMKCEPVVRPPTR